MTEYTMAFLIPMFQAIVTAIFGGGITYYWWTRRRDKTKMDDIVENVRDNNNRLKNLEEKHENLEYRHGGLGNEFVTEPRVKEIVDDRIETVNKKIENLQTSVEGKLGIIQDGLTEIMLHQAQETGYRQAMKEKSSGSRRED